MAKYINPFLDWSFKHIFGRDSVKDILIGFLNALFEGEHVIIDVRYDNNEREPDDIAGRAIIYDIYCTTDKGEKLIIEMQNKTQSWFKDRSLYYMSNAVSEQGRRGTWNYRLDAVYGVFFMNFNLEDSNNDKDSNKSLSKIKLVDVDTGNVFNPKFQQYFIELPRFNKTVEECVTEYDKWIYILKNMENINTMPFAEDRNAIFARLEETAAKANLTKEEKALYDRQWKNYNDYYNTLDYAEEKGYKDGLEKGQADGRAEGREVGIEIGRAEGKEMGIEIGRAEGRAEVAKSMKKLNMSVADIAACTGLSVEEIEKL